MMRTRIYFLFLLIAFTGLTYLQSCIRNDAPCADGKISYKNLTENERSCIVYKFEEQIRFKSDAGDTVVLTANALVDGVEIENAFNQSPGCPADQIRYEKKSILLTSSNEQLFPDLLQSVHKRDFSKEFTEGLTQFTLSGSVYKISTPLFNSTAYDSIIQVGDTALKIITIKGLNGKPLLFVNRIEGVVKFTSVDGRIWEKQF